MEKNIYNVYIYVYTYVCMCLYTGLPRWLSVKNPLAKETWVGSLGREDPLEEKMATHSCILAWEIPWTEEPGGLQSRGSWRVSRTRLSD